MKKKILNTFITRLSAAVINFIIVILLSQQLGAHGKGEASLILASIAFIIIFCDFAGGASLVYLAPRYNNFQLLTGSYLWSVFVCLVVAAGFSIYPYFSSDYLIHIVLITFIQSLMNIHQKFIMAEEKVNLFNFINFIQVLLNFSSLLFVFFGLEEKTVDAYIYSLYFSYSVGLLATFAGLPYHKFRPVFKGFADIIFQTFRYGIANQLAHITQFLSFRISYYLIEYFLDKKYVGIYSNGASIAESIWLISSSISMVQYTRIANSDNTAYNHNLTVRLVKVSFLFTSAAIFVLVLLPSEFYQIIFGGEFGEMATVIRYLSPGIIFFTFALVLGHYFSGTGRYYINAIASAIGLAVTLTTGVFLIPDLGLTGAALTASLSYFMTSMFVIRKFLGEEQNNFQIFIPEKADYFYILNEIRNLLPGFKTR
jgi:O-antigen/teichoic acid export membrane protein